MFSLFWILVTNCLTLLTVFSLFLSFLPDCLLFLLINFFSSLFWLTSKFVYFMFLLPSLTNWFPSCLKVFSTTVCPPNIVFLCLEPKVPHPQTKKSITFYLYPPPLPFCTICQMMPASVSHMPTAFNVTWRFLCHQYHTWIIRKLVQILISSTCI